MEDIQTKLSELLGREVKQVRRTDEVPPRISIIDVAIAVMGKTQHDAAQDFRRLRSIPRSGNKLFPLQIQG